VTFNDGQPNGLITALAVAVQPALEVTVTVYVPGAKLLIVWVVPPFDQLYVYPDPPLGLAVADPLLQLLQDSCVTVVVTVIPVLLFTVAVAVFVQPLLLVTVTVYVPDPTLLIVWVVPPFDQLYVYPLPPLGVAVALPLFSPQLVWVTVVVTVIPVELFTVAVAVFVHPLLDVTVTV
jgi:hypothetical protein